MGEFGMFLIAQSIVIVGALVSGYVGLRIQITRLQSNDEYFMKEVTELKDGHKTINTKVDGISRHVAQIRGVLEATKEMP
jgi:hypothetical protein